MRVWRHSAVMLAQPFPAFACPGSWQVHAAQNALWRHLQEEGAYVWAAALTQESGVAPGPRGEHALVALDEDLFVFGGEGEGVLLQSPYLLVAPAKVGCELHAIFDPRAAMRLVG